MMKDIFIRLLMAAALTLAAFAFSSSAHGQQADEDPTPTNPNPQQGSVPPAQPGASSAKAAEDQTQDALTFTGTIQQEKGSVVLKDPITKITYLLDDPSKAREFVGKQVKITGKLQMRSNTIRVDSIELIP